MNKKFDLSKITEFLEGENKTRLIAIAGLVGIALIFISSLAPRESPKSSCEESFNEEKYIASLESKIKSMVESINGVGKAKVTISLESAESYRFAKERKSQSDTSRDIRSSDETRVSERTESENKYIIIEDKNGGKKPLVETSFFPSVRGAVIVCEGGHSSAIRQQVTKAVTTILGIGYDKVFVVRG